MEEKSTSSSSSSGGGVTSATSAAQTPPRMHRRNESDSALAIFINKGSNTQSTNPDPLFNSRMLWANRHRKDATLGNDEAVSLTEFSRKASQLELRSKAASAAASEFAPPRREKTDILDLRRLELKRELEERRRTNGSSATGRHSQSEMRGSVMVPPPTSSTSSRPSRPPLLKSTSEPCAPLALFRDHQQVTKP